MTRGRHLFEVYSIDNALFPFTEIEDALAASLSKNGIPNDKMVELYVGLFENQTDIDPVRRTSMHVEVHLTKTLDIIGYDIRSVVNVV